MEGGVAVGGQGRLVRDTVAQLDVEDGDLQRRNLAKIDDFTSQLQKLLALLRKMG